MKYIFLFALLIAFAFHACKGKSENGQKTVADSTATMNETVTFSDEQLEMAEIETGKIEKRILSDEIECTGSIEAPPQNIVTVSAPMEGFIKKINYLPGMFVTAGTPVAVLEHQGYITLQQEYLQAKATFNYNKEEYKRQGELTLENAVSMKKMQNAQAEYIGIEAKYKALEKQLQLLGINPEKLTTENISSTISIPAPLSGYITRANGNTGKFVSTNEPLYEIIDKTHLHLSLKIFEKDINRLKTGQLVHFTVAGNKLATNNAKIEIIGQSVDASDHSIPIHAHITSSTDKLIPGMYVNASIILRDEPVYAVPITAIVRNGNKFALFIAHDKKFERIHISIGTEENDYVEIINPDKQIINSTIVVKGAYYLETELAKNNDGE